MLEGAWGTEARFVVEERFANGQFFPVEGVEVVAGFAFGAEAFEEVDADLTVFYGVLLFSFRDDEIFI